MSVSKDGNTGRWMSQVRVTDWTGKTIHKKKRGFQTKREAQQWEQDFLQQASGSIGMTFQDFIELYLKDMEQRLKPSTVANKRFLIDLKITPFFGKMSLNAIKPTDIRRWQNELTTYRDEKGKPYSATYLKTINNQITAIFNYAVKFYGLKENPCHKAGRCAGDLRGLLMVALRSQGNWRWEGPLGTPRGLVHWDRKSVV